MKKIIVLIFSLAVFAWLSSCWKEELSTEKKDFIVETKAFESFDWKFIIEKTGKISSKQDILLTSKAFGQVSQILVKVGDKVKKWQPLMYITDSIANYSENLKWASLNIESAKVNYKMQQINLDKNVSDAKINLDRVQKNFDISKAQIEEDMKRAKINFENSQLSGSWSQTFLKLQKIEDSIKKAEFDYTTLLVKNEEQIYSFISNSKNEYNSLLNLYTDIIEFSDTILGITPKNKSKNDSFEMFLWSTNREVLITTKQDFNNLLNYKNYLLTISTGDITEETLLDFLTKFENGHKTLITFLNLLEETLIESSDSIGFERQSYLTKVDTYQTQVQTRNTSFIALKNAVQTFLNTYKLTEESAKKQIDLLYADREISKSSFNDGEKLGEISYNKTILSLEDQLSMLESWLKSAKLSYENALKTREVSLESFQNQIKNAQNNYATALKEYSKLIITSPIEGTISQIFGDVWQDVSSTTQLFKIVSESIPEINTSFSKEEREFISEGQEVFIEKWDLLLTGIIESISEIADENLNYNATILLDADTNIIWDIVKIKVAVSTDTPLLPINVVTTKGWNLGSITVFSWGTFSDVNIRTWSVFWEYIEVVSCAKNCIDLNVVMSDITNYNEGEFRIVEK